MPSPLRSRAAILVALALGAAPACSEDQTDPEGASGQAATGGASGQATSGGASGQATTGGTGGQAATGGTSGQATSGGTSGQATSGGTSGRAPTGGASGSATAGTSGSAGAEGGSADAGSAGTNAGGGGADAGTAGTNAGGAGASGAGSGGTGGVYTVFPPGVTRPRIMIVGDSISAGPGCYKKYLVENLTQNGITNYEFVGEYEDDCGGGVMHSAVSCTTSANYTADSFTLPNCFGETSFPGLAPLVAAHNPDLILIQLGVNDVWGGSAPIDPILQNYATLLEQARAHNPNVVVVVAQIHKIITDNCTNDASTANAEELVMAVPTWAARYSMAESRVLSADLWTNSDAHEADDCVHPNDAGARRMGLNWYNALRDILN
jgi:hypothetical protein